MQWIVKWIKNILIGYIWIAIIMFFVGAFVTLHKTPTPFTPGVASDEEKVKLRVSQKEYGKKNLELIEEHWNGNQFFWDEKGRKCKIRR